MTRRWPLLVMLVIMVGLVAVRLCAPIAEAPQVERAL